MKKSLTPILLPFSILFLFSLFVSSCSKLPFSDFDSNIQAELAVPILDAKTTVKDMLNGLDTNTILRFESDGQVIAQYTAYSNPTTVLNPFSSFPSNFVSLPDSVSSIPFTLSGGIKISNADLKKGMVQMLVSNYYAEPLSITFVIPQLTQAGVAFKKTFPLAANANNVKDSLDLSNYSLTITNDAIKVYYYAYRNSTGQRVKLNNVQLAFKNLIGKYVKGYLGTSTLDATKDSFKIGFLDKLAQGDIKFYDPRITLTTENSYGIPVRTYIKTAEIVSSDKKRLALTGPMMTAGINLNYPSLTEVGTTKSTSFTIDKSNSNIVDLFYAKPTALVYDIDGMINPDGNKNIIGFMTDSSYLKMKMNIEIPIYGTVKSFEQRDTLNMSFPSSDVEYAELKVITDNGTGLNATLQVYFLDANNKTIDSLYNTITPETILKAGTVDANGKVTTPTRQTSTVKIDAAKMIRLRNTKKTILKYTFSTLNNGATPVRLYSNQEIKVKLGVIAGIKQE